MTQPNPATTTFSEAIRAASWDAHQHAEHSPFMQDLLSGRLDVSHYADLVGQHWFAYSTLEEANPAMAEDPVGSAFVFPELERVPALEADLATLLGPDWADALRPSPATRAYCERLRAACATSGGYVAHHYVRYLGDLSGGQVIRRIVERLHGIEDHAGTSFYVFDRVPDAKAFKARYRELLDTAPWSADEREHIVSEILEAYRLNTAVLDELGRRG